MLLWHFDTNRDFATVNGVKANGVTSGYGGIAGRPGNVLLVFGVE